MSEYSPHSPTQQEDSRVRAENEHQHRDIQCLYCSKPADGTIVEYSHEDNGPYTSFPLAFKPACDGCADEHTIGERANHRPSDIYWRGQVWSTTPTRSEYNEHQSLLHELAIANLEADSNLPPEVKSQLLVNRRRTLNSLKEGSNQ